MILKKNVLSYLNPKKKKKGNEDMYETTPFKFLEDNC
jgi:hypothetical protein